MLPHNAEDDSFAADTSVPMGVLPLGNYSLTRGDSFALANREARELFDNQTIWRYNSHIKYDEVPL
jgi:hypothetical protein